MNESRFWVYHLIAGAVILLLLGLHMFIMHLDAILSAIGLGVTDPVSSAHVFARSKQVFFMITYIVLLGAALYHGLYGLKNILLELSLHVTVEKVLTAAITGFGILLFGFGAFTAIYVFLY